MLVVLEKGWVSRNLEKSLEIWIAMKLASLRYSAKF
jgi:hypothetical protein